MGPVPAWASKITLLGLRAGACYGVWSSAGGFVGRSAKNSVVIEDMSVSETHAFIWRTPAGWWHLTHLAGAHGTDVNGVPVGEYPVRLATGDLVRFGGVVVAVVVPETGRPADPTPPVMMTLEPPWPGAGAVGVGTPMRSESVTVFPLFHTPPETVEYIPSDVASALGRLTVSEVSAEGRVSELTVGNSSGGRVLLLEGEVLRGGKQNRVLNTPVMLPAGAALRLPVSCVEEGRWGGTSGHKLGTGSVSTTRIRHALRSSVTRSLRTGLGHSSDQAAVWGEVRDQHHTLNITSQTRSMTDTAVRLADRVSEVRRNLPYVEGSSGLAVAVGPRIVAVDLFDSPRTCGRTWDRLVAGACIDGLMSGRRTGGPAPDQITRLFAEARRAEWVSVSGVGEGAELRAEFGCVAGSALLVDGVLIHGSLVCGEATT